MSLPAQDHSQPEILSLDEFNVAIPRDVYISYLSNIQFLMIMMEKKLNVTSIGY